MRVHSQWEMFKTSLKNGYVLVLVSSLIVLLNILLHPLAGSCFLVKPGPTTKPGESAPPPPLRFR